MKITKRVLALVVAALMIFSTFAVAASAAESVQSMINAAAAGSVVKLTKNYIGESITISKDLTLDLGGHTFEGAPGKNAITVNNNAKVTITNGFVRARFASVDSWTMLETITQSPTAIRVIGGEITLEGVRVVGSYTRVPTTTDDNLPTGTALAISHGANAVLKQAALLGDYAINNAVTDANAHPEEAAGTVTVYDSLLGGWIMAVKGGIRSVTVAEGYTMNNLKDNLDNVLTNRPFTDHEKNLLDLVLDSRFYFSIKNVDEKATVTVSGVKATVEAEEISYLWGNSTSTDCSYKYVPTYAVLDGAKKVKLDSNFSAEIDAADAENVTIEYRVLFDMMPDFKLYLTNAHHYIEELYNKALAAIDEAYVGYVDTYNEYVTKLANGNYTISAMVTDIKNTLADINPDLASEVDDLVFGIRNALLKIGGKTMFDPKYATDAAKDDSYTGWGMDTWAYYNPDKAQTEYPFFKGQDPETLEFILEPDTAKYGVLDTLEEINNQLAACYPFTNQDNWPALATLVVDNYHALLDLVPEAIDAFEELKAALAEDGVAQILEMADMSEYLGIVNDLDGYMDMATEALDAVLAYDGVQELFVKIDCNKELFPEYAQKVAYAYNHIDQYIDFNDLVADGRYLRTIFVEGETEVIRIAEPANLDLDIAGLADVSYTGVEPSTTDESKSDIKFIDSITLTAVPNEDYEFLYWTNTETDRILSTEKQLTLVTGIDKYITAVFHALDDDKVVVLTNPSGDIAGEAYLDDENYTVYAEDPYIAGFTFTGWPEATGETISAAAIDAATTDYYLGSASVFANSSAVYNSKGWILKINPNTDCIIITPKYENKTSFTVTFVDGQNEKTAKAGYNQVVTATASGANFSYWTDAEGRIVSVLPTYKYQAIQDSTFTAVYNEPAPTAVINITLVTLEGEKVSFSAERSVRSDKKVLSSGIVFGFDKDNLPDVKTNAAKGDAKDNSNAGVYTAGVKESSIAARGGVVARPYLEIEGEEVIYGEPIFYGFNN